KAHDYPLFCLLGVRTMTSRSFLHKLFRLRPHRFSGKVRASRLARPRLEELESRCVPAGIALAVGAASGIALVELYSLPGPSHLGTLAPLPAFPGGVSVAFGDVNADGHADIVVGAGAGTPEVKVFDGTGGAPLMDFFAFSPSFLGGVSVAAGDINGDGHADIV